MYLGDNCRKHDWLPVVLGCMVTLIVITFNTARSIVTVTVASLGFFLIFQAASLVSDLTMVTAKCLDDFQRRDGSHSRLLTHCQTPHVVKLLMDFLNSKKKINNIDGLHVNLAGSKINPCVASAAGKPYNELTATKHDHKHPLVPNLWKTF